MANLPISILPNLTSSGVTPNDLLVIVNYDVPSGTTKNITALDFQSYTLSGITEDIITGGTYSGGTLVLNTAGGPISINGFTTGSILYEVGSGIDSTQRIGVNAVAGGDYSLAGGGTGNTASGKYSVVSGGYYNTIDNITSSLYYCTYGSTIGGGSCNTISSYYSQYDNSYGNTIAGGTCNTTVSSYLNGQTIGGGACNITNGRFTTVSGGYRNTTNSCSSFIGGGVGNISIGNNSVTGGGILNKINGCSSFIGGGIGNLTGIYGVINSTYDYTYTGGTLTGYYGSFSPTSTLSGLGNGAEFSFYFDGSNNLSEVIINLKGSGYVDGDTLFFDGSLFGGTTGIDDVTIRIQTTIGNISVIGGGRNNTTSGDYAFIGSGRYNTSSSYGSNIVGGVFNRINSYNSNIGGGRENLTGIAGVVNLTYDYTYTGGTLTGSYGSFSPTSTLSGLGNGAKFSFTFNPSNILTSVIVNLQGSGYVNNDVLFFDGSLFGGTTGIDDVRIRISTTTIGNNSVIGGGYCNTTNGNCSVIGGGGGNTSSGYASTISGGYYNTINECYSTIGGGYKNNVLNDYTTISGGYCNTAFGSVSTIGGGVQNTTDGVFTTIGGGGGNTALDVYTTISGGYRNIASCGYGFIGGGHDNVSFGDYASIGGGSGNTVNNQHGGILGGSGNTVNHDASFIVGQGITTCCPNTTYVNCLSIVNLPDETVIGLQPGSLYYDSTTCVVYYVP